MHVYSYQKSNKTCRQLVPEYGVEHGGYAVHAPNYKIPLLSYIELHRTNGVACCYVPRKLRKFYSLAAPMGAWTEFFS